MMTKRKRSSNSDPVDTAELIDEDEEGPKRPRPNATSQNAIKQHSVTHGRVDPSSGQRSAIPGLDDYEDEAGYAGSELSYENEGMEDALQYLRSVRAEANSIPSLLVAPQPERALYDNGVGDSRGYYEDGAYTAAPLSAISTSAAAEADTSNTTARTSNAQIKYYEAVLARYESVREQLASPPPGGTVELLDQDHPRSMRSDAKDWKRWRWLIKNTEPWAAQLAAMDRESVMRVLRLIASPRQLGLLQVGKGKGISRRTSRWIWGLLGVLPERGEMGSEDVGVVRDLGKRAVLVGVGFGGVDTSGLDGGEGDDDEQGLLDTIVDRDEVKIEAANEDGNDKEEGLDVETKLPGTTAIGPIQQASSDQEDAGSITASVEARVDEAEALFAARARILKRLATPDEEKEVENGEINLEPEIPLAMPDKGDEDELDSNTRATVDMIITIVGEMYGQRDLLEYREMWK